MGKVHLCRNPVVDLVRVDLMNAGQFAQGLCSSCRFQGDLKLELSTE